MPAKRERSAWSKLRPFTCRAVRGGPELDPGMNLRPAVLAIVLVARDFAMGQPVEDAASDPGPVTVEVRGDLLPRTGDASLPSVSIERDDLVSPGASLLDLLRRVPSVAIARTGGSSDLATVSLRGGTSAQTPVYWGPILLNDSLTGTADLSLLPPMLLRRVDVYRGHAPIEVGGGLTGAIVLSPMLLTETIGRVTTSIGGYGEHAFDGTLGVGNGESGAGVYVRAAETAGNYGYVDDRGTRFDESDDVERTRVNGDARSLDVWSSGRIEVGPLDVSVLVRNVDREQGVPGLGVLPAEVARASTRQTTASVLTRVRIDEAWSLNAVLSGRRGRSQIDDPAGELLLTGARTRVTGAGIGASLATTFETEPISAQSGFSLHASSLDVSSDGLRVVAGRDLRTRAFIAIAGKPLHGLDLRAETAVTMETLRSDNATFTTESSPDARVGIAVRPHDVVELFGTVGVYHRSPLIGERLGVSASVLGNPELRREIGGSMDLGARFSGEHDILTFAAEATLFGRLAEDLIAYRRSSFGALKPFNIESARVLGTDVLIAVTIADLWTVGGTLTLNDARDTAADGLSNTLLPFVATVTASPFAGVEGQWNGVFRRASLRATFDARGERTADPAGLIALPATYDLGVEGVLSLADDVGELRVRGSNLLNQETTDLVGYPLPGTNVHASLTARFL